MCTYLMYHVSVYIYPDIHVYIYIHVLTYTEAKHCKRNRIRSNMEPFVRWFGVFGSMLLCYVELVMYICV